MIALALCEIGSIAERRIAMLIDPALSGLPAFLTPRPGLNSGFMLPQVTAAALVSENKQRAHPASVDSIPTSANQEDHVSMATHAARRLLPMAENLAACARDRAARRRPRLRLPRAARELRPVLERARALLRDQVPSALEDDRFFAPDMRGRHCACHDRRAECCGRRRCPCPSSSSWRRHDPATTTRIIRAPGAPTLSAKSWQTEAPLRMLMNNLDPDVAERPGDLVVYGGIGKAARDWDSFDTHLCRIAPA